MKRIWLIVLSVVAVGVFVVALMPRSKSEVSDDPYKFYYYPRLNAYYDLQRNDFVYTLDGGKTWQTKKPTTSALPEKLSKKVMITGPVPDVWRFNEEHRQKYDGVRSDYITEGQTAKAIVPESKVVKKTTTPPGDSHHVKPVTVKEQASTQVSTDTKSATTTTAKTTSTKKVQQIPEDEWQQNMEGEAERLIREARKHILREPPAAEAEQNEEEE
jgi:hypothetical protein